MVGLMHRVRLLVEKIETHTMTAQVSPVVSLKAALRFHSPVVTGSHQSDDHGDQDCQFVLSPTCPMDTLAEYSRLAKIAFERHSWANYSPNK